MHDEVSLIIDIGGEAVKASLVYFRTEKRPIELYSCLSRMALRDSHSATELLSEVTGSLQAVFEMINNKGVQVLPSVGKKNYNDIHIFLSSPWYMCQTRVVHNRYTKLVYIGPSVLKDIAIAEQQNFENEIRDGEYAHLFDSPLIVVDNFIMKNELNGYEINIKDFKDKALVQSIDTTLFMSVISSNFDKKVEGIVHSHAPHAKHFIHTTPLVYKNAIDMEASDIKSYLVIHAGEHNTDIIIVKKRVIIEVLSLPYGRSYFIRKVSKSMNCTSEIALSFLRLYSEGKLDDENTKKIIEELGHTSEEWRNEFCNALKDISGEAFIPSKVFLITEKDLELMFKQVIESGACSSTLLSNQCFEVVTLNEEITKTYYGNHVEDIVDPGMVFNSIFINNIFNKLFRK